MKKFFLFLSVIVSALFVVSCKESTEDDEYANWTERNKDYIDSIRVVATKSVSANDGEWKIIKNWKLVADGFGSTAVANTQDYVYCKVLESGNQETETPLYTDSVKVHYLGRLIPTNTCIRATYGAFTFLTALPTARAVTHLAQLLFRAILRLSSM